MFLLAATLVVLLGMVLAYRRFPEMAYAFLLKAERAAAGLDRRSFQLEGLRFDYLEGGRGEPLVLLHGFGANKDHWNRFARRLTPCFRVIAPDLPGFGGSSPAPDGDYSIRAQVERLDAFVHALGVASFHLGGSSMGGHIAGLFAAVHPGKVRSLLLVAPGGVVSAEPSDMHRHMMAGGANPLMAGGVEAFDRAMAFVFHEPPFVPWPVKRALIREAAARRRLHETIFEQIRRSWDADPLEDRLRGRTVPTFVLWGARDRVLHVSGAAILEGAMPQARTLVMDAVGHLPMIEKPGPAATAYLEWMCGNTGR